MGPFGGRVGTKGVKEDVLVAQSLEAGSNTDWKKAAFQMTRSKTKTRIAWLLATVAVMAFTGIALAVEPPSGT